MDHFGHHLESGKHDGCFISFTRCEAKARRFATYDMDEGKKSTGYIYEVDEDLFSKYGVVAHERPDPEKPEEFEVTLRASDNGNIPEEVITGKRLVSPDA